MRSEGAAGRGKDKINHLISADRREETIHGKMRGVGVAAGELEGRGGVIESKEEEQKFC